MGRQNAEKKEMISSTVVAVDKDKGSQYALKYAVENLLTKGQSVTLLHVKQKSASVPNSSGSQLAKGDGDDEISSQGKEIFVPFRCFCTRKEINCREVLLEDADIARALVDYVASNLVETLLLGSSSRGLVKKFRSIVDIPTSVSKSAPEFCTVYVITKGKIASVRSATCPLPEKHSLQHALLHNSSNVSNAIMESPFPRPNQTPRGDGPAYAQRVMQEEIEIKSPFLRTKNGSLAKPCEPSIPDTDKSSVSSGRPSTDRMFPSFCDSSESGMTPRLSISSDFDNRSFGSSYSGNKSIDMNLQHNFSSSSQESGKMSCSSSNNLDELETEMRRLKLELKQTMEMYSSACKEALTAKQKARELQLWKLEEQQRLEEARLSEEAALQLVEREKAKSKAAIEALEAAQRIAELEAQKRKNAEMKALKEAEERKKLQLVQNDIRYRRYTIEEIELAAEDFSDSLKIGEGGYGPVYRGYLDHTPVAIKVLRPDAAQGRSQFQQEVEVLSRIRHPNMVILLGACPEFGCLVYEYMACGSLEDRLMRRGNTPPLSWQVRFRIAAEIATALLFLHQTKPEPLVHRDLKPGNILLDRNYVSKISDVGLARLVPPSVANNVTQYRMTATAGTFCYIDPEYQQTGMLGIKSDVYSLGIMLLQIITSKPPMGLAHSVERAIEKGTFADMLDPLVPDWPMEEALRFAKLAVQCAELRRKDRPDLGKNVFPELNRLRTLAEANLPNPVFDVGGTALSPHNYGHTSTLQDMMSDQQSGYDSSRSPSSTSSSYGGRW